MVSSSCLFFFKPCCLRGSLRRHTPQVFLLLIVSIFADSQVSASPPAITSLFPAGMQRGSTAELKLDGKPGTLPLSVQTESEGLSDFQFSEKGDQLTLTASADTKSGLHWIRFYNNDGATALLPFLVGQLPERREQEPNNRTDEAEKVESLPLLINGILHSGGEVDTFSVSLDAGETLVASVDAQAALGSPMDAVLQILTIDGFVIAQNDDDHGFDPLIAWTAPQQGTYLVRIFCFPAAPNSTINFAGGADYIYRLTLTTGPFVTDNPLPESSPLGWNLNGNEQESSPETELLTVPQSNAANVVSELSIAEGMQTIPLSVAGSIRQANETDRFKITAKKGDAIRIRILARDIASHLDPVLSIRTSDGSLQKESDDLSRDDRDIDFSWKAPADNDYLLEITDRYQHGGFRYVYRMNVSRDEPRVELSVTAEQFIASREKPLEIPVTISRLAGFDKALSVSISGLPEGAVAAAVTSEPKGDSSKKLTLKIDAKEATAFQGPIQIVATYGDEMQTVLATATLKTMKQTTSKIWLTIPPLATPPAKP